MNAPWSIDPHFSPTPPGRTCAINSVLKEQLSECQAAAGPRSVLEDHKVSKQLRGGIALSRASVWMDLKDILPSEK